MTPIPPMTPPPAPPLAIDLFGPLRVLVHGEPLPRLRPRPVEWLLALLVLRHERAVERSWLAGTLWMDSRQSQALKNLRNNLLYLRTALGPEGGRIHSPTRDTLTLNLEGAEVDVLRFDAAIRAGDEDALRAAISLYTGPLLEGCDEPWALPERERREQACLLTLVTLAEAAQARGDFAGALDLLRRAEAMDPLSDSVQRHMMRALAASGDAPAALIAYREHRLRLLSEMNVEPDDETTRLLQQIRTHAHKPAQKQSQPQEQQARPPASSSAATVAATPPSALPHPLTQLIGRHKEVRAVGEQIAAARLVTLIGAGGVGKTRLAIEVARNRAGEFADGALFVPLAALSDPALLPAFVAAALGLREEAAMGALGAMEQRVPEPGFLRDALVGWLSTHSVLLVLDNCEHLVDAVAQLAQTLLEHCPRLRILATSRQRLGLTGEVLCRVPSLPSPRAEELSRRGQDAVETVLTYPSARLFVERAAMAQPGFHIADAEDALALAQVCRRLDGIPLAIELAAARTQVLTLPQIAARLDDRFRLLTGGSRTVLPRHQTLKALIDWSYDQLTAEEQALLCRLSVFAGGWSVEAAEAVGGDLDCLASLTDKSLVLAEQHARELRYRMLETVREYVRQKLQECGEEEAVRERHAEHYLQLAEQARPFLDKPEPAWLDRLETEHDNLRAALTFYAVQEERIDKAVRLAAAIEPFWNLRGHFYELRLWLRRLLLRPTPPTVARASLLGCAALYVARDKDFAGAQELLKETLAIWRQLGDPKGIAGTLNGMAELMSNPDIAGLACDPGAARALAEESLAMMREMDDKQGMAHSLFLLGRLARQVGENDQARSAWVECRALDEELGVQGGYVLAALGGLVLESGEAGTARHYYATFLTERHKIGDRERVVWGLQGLSAVALAQGEAERAARLLGAVVAVYDNLASSPPEQERNQYEALRSALREKLGEAACEAAWVEGYALTYEEAVRFALSGGRA